MRLTLATLLLLGIALGADQVDTSQAPITLTAASSKTLEIPGFSFSGNAQCDASGNLYFHTGFDPNDSIILKLRTDGSSSIYRSAGTSAAATYFWAFRVDPEGKLWLLEGGREEHEGVYLIVFGDDPNSPTRTKLDAREELNVQNVQNFVVLQNGHILLHGYFDEKAPKKERGRSYVAEFDPSGKLVRKSLNGKFSEGELKDIGSRVADAPAAQDDSGRIYLLGPDKVLVVSPNGQIERNIKFRLPEPSYRAYNLYVAGRRLVIGFYRPSEQKPQIIPRYALFDTSSGKQLRLYQPSAELGGSMVCFSDEGFTFFRVEHGRVKLLMATTD